MHSCDIWQRWARPSLAQRQPTRESTIWIWQLCHVTEHSKSHIWDRTLRSTEIKIPYMGPNRIPLKRLNISFVTMNTKMKLRWRVEHTHTHTAAKRPLIIFINKITENIYIFRSISTLFFFLLLVLTQNYLQRSLCHVQWQPQAVGLFLFIVVFFWLGEVMNGR